MEIKDWESRLEKTYNYEKINDKYKLQKYINGYEQNRPVFYTALRKDKSLIYFKTIDGIHYAGMDLIEKGNEDFIKIFEDYLTQRLDNGGIVLSDLINYFKALGFSSVEFDNLTKKQKELVNNNDIFSIKFLTENEVTDDEFYAAYVFYDLESEKHENVNTGFNANLVILGSLDNKTICSYCVITNGKLNQEDYNKFLDNINIDEINNSLKIKG